MSAVRTKIDLAAVLLGLAAAGRWSTIDRMQGMDAGPWTGLGTLGWFIGIWIAMMAAMVRRLLLGADGLSCSRSES